jgi:hypothetical protein
MLRRSVPLAKKKFTVHPRSGQHGAKNTAFRPKMPKSQLERFNWAFNLEFPRRRPDTWNGPESARLGMRAWPKAVGFYNAGDNFELTPEMHHRLFRKFADSEHWTVDHSEKTIIAQFPVVESEPTLGMGRVNETFRHHVKRFGADHVVYNAAMQARAFAKDYDGAVALAAEMEQLGLEPSAQTYFNLIFAAKMAGKPRSNAEEHFQRGVTRGALNAVMRLDTEFEMWWQQLERMGSFEADTGYLSNKEEGAKPLPKDPFAIWGWDNSERKFVTRREAVRAEVNRRTRSAGMTGTVYGSVAREPWFKWRGVSRADIRGPGPSSHRLDKYDISAPLNSGNPYTRKPLSQNK